MYNGIGLNTPRGSGTSGHVIRNASSLRPGQAGGSSQRMRQYESDRPIKTKPIDKGILEHERKRQVEIKCLELQDELEAQGLDEDETYERVDELRQQLLKNLDNLDLLGGKKIKSFETQRLAEAKGKENEVLARALRVEDGYVEGSAFDRELQDLRRQKRLLEKERERYLEKERMSRRRSRSPNRSDESGSESDRIRSYRRGRARRTRRQSRSSSRSSSSSSRSNSDSSSEGLLSSDGENGRIRSPKKHSSSSKHASSQSKIKDTAKADTDGGNSSESEGEMKEEDGPPTRQVRPVEDGEPGEIEDMGLSSASDATD
ncbi:RNA-splicing factor [Kickxella alabastrina]|uniref:RNA-splicing factor n=1 Tax=Kickxella alabastrina TaxID=61397 RepID=A0ACC1I3Q5_9FUNG|nr:RNA-splicing factor [Kickxella alabastrina]